MTVQLMGLLALCALPVWGQRGGPARTPGLDLPAQNTLVGAVNAPVLDSKVSVVVRLVLFDNTPVLQQEVTIGSEFNFLGLRDGEYFILIDSPLFEKVRVPVTLRGSFTLQFRKDIDLRLKTPTATAPPSKDAVAWKSLLKRSKTSEAYYQEARSAIELGKPAEAVTWLLKVVKEDPADFEAYNDLGVQLFKMGKPGEAEEALQKSVSINPRFFLGQFNYGRLKLQQRDLAGAVQTLRQAVELERQSARAHRYLGEALAQSGQFEMAIAEYQKCLQLDSEGSIEARLLLAKALSKLGKNTEAAAELQIFLGRNPEFPQRAQLEAFIRQYGKKP